MTFSDLGTRDRRALILGAIFLGALVVGVRGVPVWRAWRVEARATAAEQALHAAQTASVVAGFSETLDTLEARTGRLLALSPALLVGDTPAQAASHLAGVLAEAARVSSVRLDAVQTRTDSAIPGELTRMSLDVRLTADVTGLAAFLRAIESGPPLLSVQRLSVRPSRVESPSGEVETLSGQISVVGLALVRDRSEMP